MTQTEQSPKLTPSIAEHVAEPALASKRGRKPGRQAKSVLPDAGPLTLTYTLAELPSAQHRAGLAGLVLFLRWLAEQGTARGICELVSVDESGAAIRLDQEGMRGLFDELYAASQEERRSSKPYTKKDTDETIEPIRTEQRESSVLDKNGQPVFDKQGIPKRKIETFYYYPAIVPKASFLVAVEPTRTGDGPWIGLWREMLWNTLRLRPLAKKPYKDRVAGPTTDDADTAFLCCAASSDKATKLSSSLFLGAQESTAEDVLFLGRSQHQLLLHFWPLIAQAYVPRIWDKRHDKMVSVGYAIVVPDVSRLSRFAWAWKHMMEQRSAARVGDRPKDAVVDLAVEGALDLAERLNESLATLEGEKSTGRTILGVEVVHLKPEGNNVRLLSSDRIDPTPLALQEYVRIKSAYRDHIFRRQLLLNLVKERPWFVGFDALAATLPLKTQFFGSPWFRHDARTFFEQQRTNMKEQTQDKGAMAPSRHDELSQIIYRLTQSYVRRKTESKGKKRDDVARDAFLAVRSRTGSDFVEYFCGTICSVPQAISSADFQRIGRALRDDEGRAELRTLTLLALSAAAFVGFDKNNESTSSTPAESDQP